MRSFSSRLLIAVALGCSSCAGAITGTAQTADMDLPTVLGTADNRNWYVRAVGTSTRVEGTITSLGGEDVRIGGERLSVASIDTLWRRETSGGGERKGVIAGGVAGGASFGLLGALCGPGCMVAGAILGGVTGGVIGGITGSLIKPGETYWEPVWARGAVPSDAEPTLQNGAPGHSTAPGSVPTHGYATGRHGRTGRSAKWVPRPISPTSAIRPD